MPETTPCGKITVNGDVTTHDAFTALKKNLVKCSEESEEVVLFFQNSRLISSAVIGLLLRINTMSPCKLIIEYDNKKLLDVFESLNMDDQFNFKKV